MYAFMSDCFAVAVENLTNKELENLTNKELELELELRGTAAFVMMFCGLFITTVNTEILFVVALEEENKKHIQYVSLHVHFVP